MVFSGATFLYAFLPVTLILYFIAPKKWRNAVLMVMSFLFYAFGEPVYVVLLLISSLSDWLHSLFIESHRGKKSAKVALISSVVINLGLLGFFKYADFFIGTVNSVFNLAIPLTGVALPIGISFYTFQTMSYTIDVYRGRVKAQRSLISLATFVCLFPQLIAGPIVRYIDAERDLESRETRCEDFGVGARRSVLGLGKKVLIANLLGEMCDAFLKSSEQTVLYAWLYAIGFALHIYFDFSGYSDMAIGLGRIFGFRFPENFDHPYISKSATEFWRRWHMTLGGWFRDYVYIPLGGNRCSRAKWIRNIFVVWFLTGMWHGAAWNFILWGLFFGILLMLEKLFLGRWLEKLPSVISRVYLLLAVVLSFVLFNASGIKAAFETMGQMFGGAALYSGEGILALRNYLPVILIGAIGATPLPRMLGQKLGKAKVFTVLEPIFLAVILLLCTSCLIDGSFNPFIYFRF